MKTYKETLDQYRKMHNKETDILIELVKLSIAEGVKITVNDQTKVKYGEVCVILSCPGRYELIHDKPCSGRTGINLGGVLIELNRKLPKVFRSNSSDKSKVIREYKIINASQIVYFDELNGKSEEDDEEIEKVDNINRIKNSVEGSEYFIICGEKAKLAFNKVNLREVKAAFIGHLGDIAINNLYTGSFEYEPGKLVSSIRKPEDRTKKRYELIAECIIKQFSGEKCNESTI